MLDILACVSLLIPIVIGGGVIGYIIAYNEYRQHCLRNARDRYYYGELAQHRMYVPEHN